MMNIQQEQQRKLKIARRHFLKECGVGVGKMALAGLLTEGLAQAAPTPHFGAKAKHVIHLFMAGAPSQLDLFDNKPMLAKYEGQPLPKSIIGDQRYAFIRSDSAVLGPRYKFSAHGKCGMELSEMLPHLGSIADEICLIRSVSTEQFNHAPAQLFFNTGFAQPGRPSMGSWVVYALGSESKNLPSFVVLSTGAGISGGASNWSSGFMPTQYTGVRFRNQGDAILDTASPQGVDEKLQRDTLDLIASLNRQSLEKEHSAQIAARMASYEMAARLQTAAPELMNLKSESKETLAMYGCDPDKPSFARGCLLARRMIERGVRFVNIYHEGWDAHSDVAGVSKQKCGETDQASAALVKDLKQRGLLDETLVIWGGEFGRTPMVESNAGLGRSQGRDHHPSAYTMWMAGGGVKAGFSYGETDEFGFHVTKNPVPIHDLQATILHLLGLDHTKLTYHHAGRDYRLTDVYGNVVKDLLA
jgi:uncharacterized protein (DUF1501 family)